MPSRQFEYAQKQSLKRLRSMVPAECPLLVQRLLAVNNRGGFMVQVLDSNHVNYFSGRFEVVAAYIAGYVTAWEGIS